MKDNRKTLVVLILISSLLLILTTFSMRMYRTELKHKEEIINMQKWQLEHLEPSCDK